MLIIEIFIVAILAVWLVLSLLVYMILIFEPHTLLPLKHANKPWPYRVILGLLVAPAFPLCLINEIYLYMKEE